MLILGLFQVRYDFLTNDLMLIKLNTLLSLRFKRTEMDLVCPCVSQICGLSGHMLPAERSSFHFMFFSSLAVFAKCLWKVPLDIFRPWHCPWYLMPYAIPMYPRRPTTRMKSRCSFQENGAQLVLPHRWIPKSQHCKPSKMRKRRDQSRTSIQLCLEPSHASRTSQQFEALQFFHPSHLLLKRSKRCKQLLSAQTCSRSMQRSVQPMPMSSYHCQPIYGWKLFSPMDALCIVSTMAHLWWIAIASLRHCAVVGQVWTLQIRWDESSLGTVVALLVFS